VCEREGAMGMGRECVRYRERGLREREMDVGMREWVVSILEWVPRFQ